MNWDDETALFKDHLKVERNLSPHTLSAYLHELRRFNEFMTRRGISSAAKTARRDIYDFMEHLTSKGLSRRSVSRAISAIRTFFKFISGEQGLKEDPASELTSPKPERALPSAPDYADVEMLMNAVDLKKPGGLRDRAILETLYSSGLRVSEVITLRLPDLSIREGVVRVRGKGRKERMVPIGETAIAWVGRWVAESRGKFVGKRADPGFLFLNARGGGLTRQAVWLMVKAAARRAGLKSWPHALRHAFATHLVEAEVDLRSVQEMLGHANIATTQVYTSVSRRHLRAIHKKYHPRG